MTGSKAVIERRHATDPRNKNNMNGYRSDLVLNGKVTSSLEMNNNSDHMTPTYRHRRSDSRNSSVSSASSIDTSEEFAPVDVAEETNLKSTANEVPDKRRFRSMSDGSPSLCSQDEPFEVFPSLPDTVLEKMGLTGDSPRERMNDDDLEQQFVSLALAFSIDAATIKSRSQRQKRYMDQTEKNLMVELDRLVDKSNKMQMLCVDAETAELLTDLLAQIDVVRRACTHATISAERFGAVQHEDRLSQSVQLMINHVTVLKQQRDSARKHLQYTKRVLQNTHSAEEPLKSPLKSSQMGTPALSKRRASIASITQQKSLGSIELKRITRRPSDMSFRATALPRTSRPSRLELGVDLVKIREGTIENMETPQPEDGPQSMVEHEHLMTQQVETVTSHMEQINYSDLTFRDKMAYKMQKLNDLSREKYKNWVETGAMHEIFIVGTFLCFALSLISMGNILIELEYAKRNITENSTISELWIYIATYFNSAYGEHAVIT